MLRMKEKFISPQTLSKGRENPSEIKKRKCENLTKAT